MLDRDLLRRDPDAVRAGILRKGLDPSAVDTFLNADREWRAKNAALEAAREEGNRAAKSIGALMAQGKRDEAEAAKAAAAEAKRALPGLEAEARALESVLREIELEIPNLPHASVPDGRDETQNVVVRTWGEPPALESPKPHWEVAEGLNLFDLPRGAKISGSGFPVYVGAGARLQRALGTFFADRTSAAGYLEVYPPVVVNRESLVGTGQLPKFEDDLYRTTDDLFLVPTAEVPITNLYRDEILDGGALPVSLCGLSACFRREAGAAGKDTRGIQRVHQFDKVEMVVFARPEESYAALEKMTADAERLLRELGLHHRVIEICAGDIGPKGAKQYDLEVWAPGVERWLEVSSCSNFEAYQSRRAGIRYRADAKAKPEFVHILNGSGLAVPRVYAAILESGLRPDGTVTVPEALRPYVGTDLLVPGPRL